MPALVALCFLCSPGGLRGQEPETTAAAEAAVADTVDVRPEPDDTYADAGVRDLIIRAKRERFERAQGLESFEVTFRERIYAGLGGRVIRRERAVFHQERAAEVYWSADGERVVKWLGVRRGVPIAGLGVDFEDDPRTDDAFDLDFDFLDPAEDRVFLGADWALHPLADSAAHHYRYRSGDTLRIRFPGSDQTVTLVEAVVEPREGRFDRIVGSLWFDRDQALLARAAYRPAIDYDMQREDPEDLEDVPAFVQPIRGKIEFITVDYGLQELRWWLPNRMAFDGVGQAGGIATMPIRFEWTFEDYVVDQPTSLDPGEGGVPEGWTRWEEDHDEIVIGLDDEDAVGSPDTVIELDSRGRPLDPDLTVDDRGRIVDADGRPVRGRVLIRASEADSTDLVDPGIPAWRDSLQARETRTVHIVPPIDSLLNAPELPEPLFTGSVEAFDDDELSMIQDRLDELGVPSASLPGADFLWGFSPGLMRYNRVEGLSAGMAVDWWTGEESRFEVLGRIGVPEFEPGLELKWQRESPTGSLGIAAYRRLTSVGDWGRPLGFGNSLNTLFVGYDSGLYFRQTGGEIFASTTGARTRWEGRVFGELQQNAPKTTEVALPHAWSDEVFPDNLESERGTVYGVSGRVRVFSSVDPGDPILAASIWGEAATGDYEYGRIAASGSILTPIAGSWMAGLETAGGTTFGTPSAQRLYYLGGPYTLRAFDPGAAGGEAFLLGRFELGYGFSIGSTAYDIGGSTFRITAFSDAAWAGDRDAFAKDGWKASVGLGFSMMDGLFRFDIAHSVTGEDVWQLHIYSDGIM